MATSSGHLTRKDKSSAEGKALGHPSVKCGLCQDDISIKHCNDCKQPLCVRCVTAHGNLPFTKKHKLVDMNEYHMSNDGQSSSYEPECFKHPNQSLSAVCEDCLQSLCKSCVGDHIGHNVKHAHFETSFLHNICVKKVPGLMLIIQKLETLKDGSSQKLELYKQARELVKEWSENLMKIIRNDADQLLGDIELEIKKQETLCNNTSTHVSEYISKTDDFITILGNARKLTDSSMLLNNINECHHMIENAKSLIANIESMQTSFTIDDVLPFRNKQCNLEKELHVFFTMNKMTATTSGIPTHQPLPSHRGTGSDGKTTTLTATKGSQPRGTTHARTEYSLMKKIAGHYLGKKSRFGFFIGETNEKNMDCVVLFDKHGTTVHVYDVVNNTIKTHNCGLKIHKMCSLNKDRHLVRDSYAGVHVVDENFQIIATMKGVKDQKDFVPASFLFCKETNTIIMTEHKERTETRLSKVTLGTDNTFTSHVLCKLDFFNIGWLISLFPDNEHVVMTKSAKTLCKVNIRSGAYVEIDLQNVMKTNISCISTDKSGNVLIGDFNGNIHKMIDMKYKGQIPSLKCDIPITGIAERRNKIIIANEENVTVFQ